MQSKFYFLKREPKVTLHSMLWIYFDEITLSSNYVRIKVEFALDL